MYKNRVVHFELGADDPQELADFYEKALGWKIKKWEGADYWLVGDEGDREEGAINGGIMPRFEKYQTINTLSTDDIDATIKAITDNGGKVVKEKQEMPMGDETMIWCYCLDPQGNVFGLMQMVKNEK